MSSPSIQDRDKTQSPLTAGGRGTASKHAGEQAEEGGLDEQASAERNLVGASEVQASSSTNYPVDDNVFHSAASQPGNAEEETSYLQPTANELLPPPDFKPFFIVIEDPETGEHYHPMVHYVFSDDDPDIFTNAALDSLDQPSASSGQPSAMEERIAVLDMAADGKTVMSVSSLSAEWQALNASITQAPSWGENTSGADRGLMLKLHGRQTTKAAAEKEKKSRVSSLEDLVKTYCERLTRLNEALGRQQDADAQEHSTHV